MLVGKWASSKKHLVCHIYESKKPLWIWNIEEVMNKEVN
jgi:hypothetical protein